MSQPLTSPKTSASANAAASALGTEWPCCTICSTSPAGTASDATRERSTPRPITTTDMASPRMPRIATFCSSVSILPVFRKPGKKSEKPTNKTTNRMKTMTCWENRNVFIAPHVPVQLSVGSAKEIIRSIAVRAERACRLCPTTYAPKRSIRTQQGPIAVRRSKFRPKTQGALPFAFCNYCRTINSYFKPAVKGHSASANAWRSRLFSAH